MFEPYLFTFGMSATASVSNSGVRKDSLYPGPHGGCGSRSRRYKNAELKLVPEVKYAKPTNLIYTGILSRVAVLPAGTGTLQYFVIFDGNLFEYFSCLIFCHLDSDLNLDPNGARLGPGSGSALYRYGSGNVGMWIQNTG